MCLVSILTAVEVEVLKFVSYKVPGQIYTFIGRPKEKVNQKHSVLKSVVV